MVKSWGFVLLPRNLRNFVIYFLDKGFQEVGPDSEHVFNSHIIIDSEGEIVDVYRKLHLFDVSIENGPVLQESRYTSPGNELKVVDSPFGKLGLSTCYDLRFPELYCKLVYEMGAQIIFVPSAFTVPTGRAHWEILLRARAIEMQAYVIAAAQVGKHSEKVSFSFFLYYWKFIM